jgi:hypothetical protein
VVAPQHLAGQCRTGLGTPPARGPRSRKSPAKTRRSTRRAPRRRTASACPAAQ